MSRMTATPGATHLSWKCARVATLVRRSETVAVIADELRRSGVADSDNERRVFARRLAYVRWLVAERRIKEA